MEPRNPTKSPDKQVPPEKDPHGPEFPQKEPDSMPEKDDEESFPPDEPEHDVERPERRPGHDQDIERG